MKHFQSSGLVNDTLKLVFHFICTVIIFKNKTDLLSVYSIVLRFIFKLARNTYHATSHDNKYLSLPMTTGYVA